MANTYTTSKIVRLYDQRTPTKLLHPETELSAVVCTSGGLVVIADNDISVPASSVGAVISTSGFIQEPILEATTGGTVTNIGNSTGYGTLLKTISTTETVRLPATSASNDYIPTELAVAVGLDRKQAVLSAGNFISLTPDGAGHDVIAVSPVTSEIRTGTSAVDTALPTEKAVQIAIGVASHAAVIEAMTSVGAAGYATQVWTQNNFLSSGGAHDWGYANNQAAGVVRPVAGSGLLIGDSGALSVTTAAQYATYAAASEGIAGMVRVTSEVVSAANAAQSAITVVPTTDAVYRAIQAHSSTQKPISSGSGITVTDSGGSYTIAIKSANATSMGGVAIPTSGGLLINGGSVSVAGATVQASYADAHTVPYAGVRVLNSVTSTNVAADLAAGYVPSVQAVYNYVVGATASIMNVVNQTFVTKIYIQENYVSKGTGPDTNWGSATATSMGVVMVPSENGLSVTDGVLSYEMPAAQYVELHAATVGLGGVRIASDCGLTVEVSGDTAGNLSLAPASTNNIGGVVLLDNIATVTGSTEYHTNHYLPTEQAIVNYVDEAVAGATATTVYEGAFKVIYVTGTTFDISGGVVYRDGSNTPAPIAASHCLMSDPGTIWLQLTPNGNTYNAVYADSPVLTGATTSFPIAWANNETGLVTQYQLGPIVVRGRWT